MDLHDIWISNAELSLRLGLEMHSEVWALQHGSLSAFVLMNRTKGAGEARGTREMSVERINCVKRVLQDHLMTYNNFVNRHIQLSQLAISPSESVIVGQVCHKAVADESFGAFWPLRE